MIDLNIIRLRWSSSSGQDKEDVDALIQEIEILRMINRYGSPFDPTGAKTGTEIQSLRSKIAKLEDYLNKTKGSSIL